MTNNTIKIKFQNLENICTKILKYIFSSFLGFIISKASIFDLSPFSTSLLSVIPFFDISLLSYYIGTLFGLISKQLTSINLKYIAINSLLTISILIFGKNNYKNNIYSFILPGVITFAGGIIHTAFNEISIINILFCLLESILASCCAFFIKYSGRCLILGTRLDTRDLISINLTINILLISFKEYTILGINLSVITVITLLYICSYFISFKTTALFILPLCISLNVFGVVNKIGMISLIISSIATSYISKLDRKYIIPSYFIVFSTIISLNEFSFESVRLIISPLLSSIPYLLIPKKQTAKFLNQYIELKNIPEMVSPIPDSICDRFNEQAYLLSDSIGKQTISPILDSETKLKLIKKYKTLGLNNIDIINFYNKYEKQLININFTSKFKIESDQIESILEKNTNQSFKLIDLKINANNYNFKFEQSENYVVECYALFKAKNDETVCGDSISAFKTNSFGYCIILADGMGSGKDAYIKSKNTVSLLKKLLISGVTPEKAIETVNSSIMILNDELGFSTIDLCNISLKTAMAEIYKCGSYLSLIARNNSISKISGGGYPAGLEENNKPIKESIQLLNDDILIMLSDGLSNAIDYVEAEILLNSNESIETIAKQVLSSAYENTNRKYDDDMSVIVCKIIEKKE